MAENIVGSAKSTKPGSARVPLMVWVLGFVSMLMDVSSEMIHALLPLYMVNVLGASTALVGLVEGLAEATASVTKIFSGSLSDRLARRKELTAFGYGLAALSKPIFPLATTVGWVLVARFVDRIGKGIRGAPRDALIADLSTPEDRGASFGLRQTLDTIGAFVGPLLAIALMLASSDNYRLVFWVAVIPALLSFVLVQFFVREPERAVPAPRGDGLFGIARIRRLGRPFWLVVAVSAVFTLARFSEAFLVLRAQSVGLPVALAPAVYVLMNVVYALAAFPAGAFSDRFSRKPVLAAGMVVLIFADLLLAFAPSPLWVGAGVILWGLHLGLTQGLFAALIADTTPADLRGTGYGVFNFVGGIALLVASVFAGLLWDAIGARGTFLCGAVFPLLAVAGLLVVSSEHDRTPKTLE